MATVVTPTNSSTPSRQATDLNLDVGLERDWSPIRKTRREHNRLTPRDWSPCRRTSELSRFRSDWSPHRRSSNPATPTLSREWSPVRRGSSVVNTSPFGSPRSKAEAFASLKSRCDVLDYRVLNTSGIYVAFTRTFNWQHTMVSIFHKKNII